MWEIGGDTYSHRGHFLLPRARGYQRLHPLASRVVRDPLRGCVSYARLRFSALCPNLTAWFSSWGLPPVTHVFNRSALIVLSCLLITTWQLIKEHWVTRNKPKIHGICYITVSTRPLLGKKKYILSVMCDFHMTNSLWIDVYAFPSRVLMPFLVDVCCFWFRWTCPLFAEDLQLIFLKRIL